VRLWQSFAEALGLHVDGSGTPTMRQARLQALIRRLLSHPRWQRRFQGDAAGSVWRKEEIF